MKIISKISQIVEAWAISYNPTDKQKELANKRLEICAGCPFMKQVLGNDKMPFACDQCGCPISKKIFTNSADACPMHNWSEIDKDYFQQKFNRTII